MARYSRCWCPGSESAAGPPGGPRGTQGRRDARGDIRPTREHRLPRRIGRQRVRSHPPPQDRAARRPGPDGRCDRAWTRTVAERRAPPPLAAPQACFEGPPGRRPRRGPVLCGKETSRCSYPIEREADGDARAPISPWGHREGRLCHVATFSSDQPAAVPGWGRQANGVGRAAQASGSVRAASRRRSASRRASGAPKARSGPTKPKGRGAVGPRGRGRDEVTGGGKRSGSRLTGPSTRSQPRPPSISSAPRDGPRGGQARGVLARASVAQQLSTGGLGMQLRIRAQLSKLIGPAAAASASVCRSGSSCLWPPDHRPR